MAFFPWRCGVCDSTAVASSEFVARDSLTEHIKVCMAVKESGRQEGLAVAAKVADIWESHYPTDIWPTDGTSLDAKAAKHGRHVARMIAEDIRKLASTTAPEPATRPPVVNPDGVYWTGGADPAPGPERCGHRFHRYPPTGGAFCDDCGAKLEDGTRSTAEEKGP